MNRYGAVMPQKRPDPVYKTSINGGSVLRDYRPELEVRCLGVRDMPQIGVRSHLGHGMLMRVALSAGVAAILLCANGAARAGDDDDGPSVMSRILTGIGLVDPHAVHEGIDYNERSPLVVPPTRDLPAPQNANVNPTPNWPKDQDIQRREKAKAEDKRVRPHRDYQSEAQRPLRPDELNVNAPKGNAPGDGDYTADSLMRDPRDTGAKKSLFSGIFRSKTEYATFTGEPTRDTLTDPPPGYLTPSPDQPYGVGQSPAQYHVKTLGERVEPTR